MVSTIMTTFPTLGLPEPFIQTVLDRLRSFGYAPDDADAFAIGFSIQKVVQEIRNECNVSAVPEGLYPRAVDMACGEFLMFQHAAKKLQLENLDLTGAVSSISLGDTSVQFDTKSSDEEKLMLFISHLMQEARDEFICYRKLKW